MSIDKQKNIWNKNWQGQINVNPQIILNSHFTLEAYHYLKKFINTNSKSQKILEAGCGTGRFCCLIANDYSYSKVIGMDLSQNSISISNSLKEYLKVPNVFFVKGNLFQIPYPNNYFDIVGNEGVIEHYKLESHPNYIDALREMVRVTNKGGKIIIAVPSWLNLPHTCYKWILNRLGKRFEYGSEKSFKSSKIKRLFFDLGLKEIEVSGFYPSYGFYRLSGKNFRRIFYFLGKFTDLIFKYPDKITNNYFTKKFGFEIVIKGIKT